MNDINITIKQNKKGIDELEAAARNFLENVAENIRLEAKTLVPVDTGLLRSSIDVYDGEDRNEKLIGSKGVHYALYVESGTVKMQAQPYIVPALDNIVAEINRRQ